MVHQGSCEKCGKPWSWTTRVYVSGSVSNTAQLFAYARLIYVEDERFPQGRQGDNVWGCEECQTAGLIQHPLIAAIVADTEQLKRDINERMVETMRSDYRGYPVNGVSTPITAADCNPHAEPLSVRNLHARVVITPEAIAASQQPKTDEERRVELRAILGLDALEADLCRRTVETTLVEHGFFTACDPGDENDKAVIRECARLLNAGALLKDAWPDPEKD